MGRKERGGAMAVAKTGTLTTRVRATARQQQVQTRPRVCTGSLLRSQTTRGVSPLSLRGNSVRVCSSAQIEVQPLADEAVAYEKQDYAVVELGGSQVIVEVGGLYDTNRLDAEPGSVIKLNRVLLVKSQGNNDLRLGKPYVEEATVEAEVVQHKKAKKVVVYKMQPKKHTRSKRGHRQHETTIKW